MRVLIAHSFYRTSGGEDTYVRQQSDLCRLRHEVFLLDVYNRELRSGLAAGGRMLYSRHMQRTVDDIIRSFRPDLIHLHNSYPALGPAAFLAADRWQIPLVMTVHNYRLRCPNGLMFTEGSICARCQRGQYLHSLLHPCFPTRAQGVAYASSLWVHRFIARLEEKVSLFICPSEFMYATMRGWDIPTTKLDLIRNFTPPIPDPDPSPGEYGIYVGRLSKEKGLDVLLQALRSVGDPPFKILGDGPESDRLRRSAQQLELMNTIFVGRAEADEVDRAMRRARFVALPSIWNENAPLAALEAMARGRPLLVSAVGGLEELVRGGGGYVSRPGEVHDLARNIDLLMADDARCQRAGAAALEFAHQELTPERHLARLEIAYERLIERD